VDGPQEDNLRVERTNWRVEAAIAAGLFLLNALLLWPLFLPGEFPYRDSIEGGYASMSRFIASYPDPWGWNPTHYCGLPTQFMYLPLLLYATAFLHWIATSIPVDHAYRLLVALAACAGPVTVYFFVRSFTKSRKWALAAALTYTFFSPSYGLIWQIDKDRGLAQLPWRIQVLVKYGEGPHNAALTLAPLALVAAWRAAVSAGFGPIFLAAVLFASTTLTNWAGALGLAWCSLVMLVLGTWERKETGFQAQRFLAAGGLGYLLAAFWLTPSFIQRTVLNWPADAFAYRWGREQVLLMGGFLLGLALMLELRRRRWVSFYLAFLLTCWFGFAWVVLGFYWFNLNLLPESRRYALEFELFLLLAGLEALRLAVSGHRAWIRYPAMAAALLLYSTGVRQAWAYVSADPERWRPQPAATTTEYELASWLNAQQPRGRIFASGGLRFRMNAWFPLPQVGGTFETGLHNRLPLDFTYQIRTGIQSKPGEEGADAIRQLQAMAVEYVVVHGRESEEYYHDFSNPKKFEGLLEAPYRRLGDTIYRVPFRSYAHLVRPHEFPQRPPLHAFLPLLTPYANALQDPQRPTLAVTWEGPKRLRIDGPIPEGMAVALAVSYDEGWSANQQGRRIPVERTALGFMKLTPRPQEASTITLTYRGAREQRLMAFLSLLAWGASFALLVRERRRRRA